MISYLTEPHWDLYKITKESPFGENRFEEDLDRTITELIGFGQKVAQMAHPHNNCPNCKEANEAHAGAFAVAATQLFKGSFQELYYKLLKRGFKITHEPPEVKTSEPKP